MPKTANTTTQHGTAPRHSTTAQQDDGLSLLGWLSRGSRELQLEDSTKTTAVWRLCGFETSSTESGSRTAVSTRQHAVTNAVGERHSTRAVCRRILWPEAATQGVWAGNAVFCGHGFFFSDRAEQGRKTGEECARSTRRSRATAPIPGSSPQTAARAERAGGLLFSGQETHTRAAACLQPHFALAQPLDRRKEEREGSRRGESEPPD